MQEDDEYAIKKLPAKKRDSELLPVWFNHIIYNKMMPSQDFEGEAKDNPALNGFHFFSPIGRPLSGIIDYSKLKTDE